jgi:HlyD family secretion protein
LRQAQTNLRYTDILAPTDGIVISRAVNVGQTVAASLQAPVIFTIAQDLRAMEVHTNIAESDIGRLRSGMAATFGVDAYPTERFRGSTVRWEVTFIALQRADALRKGMAANEPYLLIRGPGEDASVVYAAVPPSLLPTVRGLTPMAPLIITARVREGRSDPVGVPILDLLTVAPAR